MENLFLLLTNKMSSYLPIFTVLLFVYKINRFVYSCGNENFHLCAVENTSLIQIENEHY